MTNDNRATVLSKLRERFQESLSDLNTLVKIPSISFPDFDHNELDKSADAVAALLKKRGLENVQIVRLPGVFPYVYGERLKAKDAPTVLLYAHHDVQPPGRKELWESDPFTPTERDGPGGKRLYGRGTADDKAGIIVHTAAIDAFLSAGQELPVNVKILIEGEEEIGSPNLPKFLEVYKDLVNADIIILTDTANYDCGVPSLTTSLRGIVALDIEVRALTKKIHSGLWGGPVPDPAMALSKLLASLTDEKGQIAIPEIAKLTPPLSAAEEVNFQELAFDEDHFRDQCGMVAGSHLLKQGPNPIAQIWRFPNLAINAIQASSRDQAGNVINDIAWARLTVRVSPGINANIVSEKLQEYLRKNIAWGLELHLHEESPPVQPWHTDPSAPENRSAFDAAQKALALGYDRKPVLMGCGATIPFVKPFAAALKGAPALLIGVEDPYTNAHGENESLLISDLEKSALSQVHLFNELATWKRG